MIQWEYQITVHDLPAGRAGQQAGMIECDQTGQCFIPYGTLSGGLGWLEDLFREKGKDGWELVQSGYHQRELLCIWKKKVEIIQRG